MVKKLFITYAWADNPDGDFDFIVQELEAAGLQVVFDRVALTPGLRLWEQIATIISSSDIDAWAILVTPNSLASEKCKEEYYIALGRALDTRGGNFPLLALVHGADFKDLPPGLQIRLGISLSDADWVARVVAGVERRAPSGNTESLHPIAHQWYQDKDGKKHLELRPRVENIVDWRVGIPLSHRNSVTNFQNAPSGSIPVASISYMTEDRVGSQYRVVGAQGPIGGGMSTYLTFEGPIPDHIAVGSRGKEYILRLS